MRATTEALTSQEYCIVERGIYVNLYLQPISPTRHERHLVNSGLCPLFVIVIRDKRRSCALFDLLHIFRLYP
jgi:hypothetical protein